MYRKILIKASGSAMLLLLLVLASCSPVKVVSTNAASDFRLANYRTFDFYRLDVESPMHPEFRQRIDWIRDAVSDYIESRGLSYSFEDPELVINIDIVIQEVEEAMLASSENEFLSTEELDYHNPFTEEVIDQYEEGTITIDFIDLAENTTVWRGVVQAVMAPTEEGSRANIADGVKKMSGKIP